jgi:AcrR family transcriptional regulator
MEISGKEKIREATRQMLINGETKISTRIIAEKAGVSTSLIFHFYKSKKELLIDTAEKVAQDFILNLKQIADQQGPADQKLINFLKTFLILSEQGRYFINFLFQRLFYGEADFLRIGHQVYSQKQNLVTQIVNEGVASGLFRAHNATYMTEIIIRFLDSISFEKALVPLECQSNQDLQRGFDFLISLLKYGNPKPQLKV